jgi:chromosome segregation ATPase
MSLSMSIDIMDTQLHIDNEVAIPLPEMLPERGNCEHREGNVESTAEKLARIARLQEEKESKRAATAARKQTRERYQRDLEARRRARQKCTINAYFRREDPIQRRHSQIRSH